jgi:hypothetical protein
MSTSSTVDRPFGATILAILAGIAAVLAAIHALQALGIIPYFIGPVAIRSFNFWYVLMWGLLVWVYVWLVQMLWRVDPQAWIFLAVITVFNLVLAFIAVLGETTWTDLSVSIILNAVILIYIMLPNTQRAFRMKP